MFLFFLLIALNACDSTEEPPEMEVPEIGLPEPEDNVPPEEERQTSFFIDSMDGDDSSKGDSPDTAWKTFQNVNSKFFQAGDTILLKSGRVWNDRLDLKGAGSENSPIIVDSYGDGSKPIINGGGVSDNRLATVLLNNIEYIEINNLEITNTNGSTENQGKLWGILGVLDKSGGIEANHIYIKSCYIHDVNGNVAGKDTGGIYFTAFGEDPSRYVDLQIVDNIIDNVGGLGIATQSNHASINASDRYPFLDVLIKGNRVSNTGRNNVIIRVSDNPVVEHNTLINSSRFDTGHSIFTFNTNNAVIQFNEAYGNRGEGDKDRGAYDADWNCKNTKIQYNYSHDNHWGFAIMKKAVNENVVIRYNISQNDDKAIYFYGFNSERGMTRAKIYNNTHYIKSGISLAVFGSGETGRTAYNTDFFNNIFYFEDEGSSWGNSNNVNFENNAFYNITPQGTNYITSDPMLTNPGKGRQDIEWSFYPNILTGYQIQASSPCIDSGRVVENNGGSDFWGNPLYQDAPDIGAGEFRN